ncbi:hypothetical protein [Nereida sp. MMG025]|uniref:hypothetical protein n=1 Tax=Nereida sp. MMG025 TaxID=2909981 RepID=UPI001F3592F3|nr:hypothetical protein [Nereida sp. MMG025]MCF6443550.1 hypothetical protein [Nereida sp. MMG025]
MLKFLFKRRGAEVEAKVETQREQFGRVTSELNALMALQGDKPKVTIDPASGTIEFELPEQLADEALALPAPSQEQAEEEPAADTDDAVVEGKADDAEPKEEKAA